MSYDIAVWEGDRPLDDAEALQVYEAMWEKYEDTLEGNIMGPFFYFAMTYTGAAQAADFRR